MINKVMENMGLSESEKDFIRNNEIEQIESKVKAIWQVVEDSSEYARL